jgi:hypothetical protein
MAASHPEILFLYTAIVPAAPQKTVRDAGIEPGTVALQSGVILAFSQLSHHILFMLILIRLKMLPVR